MTASKPLGAANRLAAESSPYLLQHAHNPVDWYSWGPEAFAAARERDVPIFLSIGYSTCYWCHVMERESFEDEATARLMNERFVCIKVDREERPDVDDAYMAATQILSGRGGWPMSVWLEPGGLRPFWAGTYYPPKPMHGLPSFTGALGGMSRAWSEQRADVLGQAERLASNVHEQLADRADVKPVGRAQVSRAVSGLLKMHDNQHGGFGGAPKFPQPVYLEFLLDVRAAAGDDGTRSAIDAVLRRTLDAMAIGGLFDQVGGGFHRYCIDATWTVPHFEKMLYDNAQLLNVYGRAAAVFGDELYASTAARTLAYLCREMDLTDSAGGFAAAQDAEVRGREGLNYVWTAEQAAAVLSGDELELATSVYGLGEPNFQDPHHPDKPATVVPRLRLRPEDVAEQMGVPLHEFRARLGRVNAALLAARDEREQPGRDGKMLAAWNGMLLTALRRPEVAEACARAGSVGVANGPAAVADRLGRSLVGALAAESGGLVRAAGTDIPAVLEDSAHLIAGLSQSSATLAEAERLAAAAMDRFGAPDGGFFDTEESSAEATLFVRPRTTYDGATPCGGSVMIHALIDLGEALGIDGPGRQWIEAAARAARAMSGPIAEQPIASVNAARGVFRLLRLAGHAAMPDDLRGMILVTLDAERANATGWAAANATEDPDGASPVQVLANADRLVVGPDSPAEFIIKLQIAEGHHVVAADPTGDDDAEGRAAAMGLHALRIGLVSGMGVGVYADYPAGEPVPDAAARGDTLMVHTGEVEVRVAVTREPGVGVGPGRPILGISYQVCTGTECLMPRARELDIAIDGVDEASG